MKRAKVALAEVDGGPTMTVTGWTDEGVQVPYNKPHVVTVEQPTLDEGKLWAVEKVIVRDAYGDEQTIPAKTSDDDTLSSFEWTPKPGDQLRIFHRPVGEAPAEVPAPSPGRYERLDRDRFRGRLPWGSR